MAETLFNLSDPRVRAGVENHLERLRCRTIENIEALHYVLKGGWYTCLDVNLSAVSAEELDEIVLRLLSTMPSDAILPHSPIALWREALTTQKLVSIRKLAAGTARHFLIVALCEVSECPS